MKSSIVDLDDKKVLDLGMIASGNFGPWMVTVDQTTGGAERWFVQIRGPSLQLYIEIHSVQVIDDTARLFDARVSTVSEASYAAESLEIGELAGMPLRLIFDDEFRDRCFFAIAENTYSGMRFAITGDDFEALAAAVRKVNADLHQEGWLAC